MCTRKNYGRLGLVGSDSPVSWTRDESLWMIWIFGLDYVFLQYAAWIRNKVFVLPERDVLCEDSHCILS